jgi:hypothetical protein
MARVARAYQPPNRFIRIVAEFSDSIGSQGRNAGCYSEDITYK